MFHFFNEYHFLLVPHLIVRFLFVIQIPNEQKEELISIVRASQGLPLSLCVAIAFSRAKENIRLVYVVY